MTFYIALWEVDTYGFDDVPASLAALEAALAKAEEQGTQMDATCLFAAPEFLFTKSRDEHFMDEDAKEDVLQRLTALSVKYKRWLMVPGTVGWFKTRVRMPRRAARREEEERSASPRNPQGYVDRAWETPVRVLPAYTPEMAAMNMPDPLGTSRPDLEEYLGDRDSELAYVQQQTPNVQDLRFARNTAYVLKRGALIHKYSKQIPSFANGLADVGRHDQRQSTLFLPGKEWPLFQHSDMTFGLEICSEHGVTHLANRMRFGTPPDIHLLLSAYTSTFEDGIASNWNTLVHADSRHSKLMYEGAAVDPLARVPLDRGTLLFYEMG
ncbi:hypothetical protein [Acanthopleuribacter pedis]|uniref:Uncharacterized protein n=1 Tax=Acanthopleuribacter pedis TaxID=442870 RepID=A0A8J7U7F8_9BACT|nr:hypothetical protein [Acanthopleuribacter pedis]MBO1321366.1 hypothetical protein [Acanthopleuribacter pedis]